MLVIGVDLGGTNVRAGVFNEAGEAIAEPISNPSNAQDGTESILDSLSGTIRQAQASVDQPVGAIGLAIPVHIDNKAGVVRWAPNFGKTVNGVFESWRNVPIRAPLSKYVDVPVFMDNDANMAALGEYRYGTGRGSAKCFVMLTLGTGIGGGVILSPESVIGNAQGPLILVGGNHGGAELGHTVIDHNGLDSSAGAYGVVEGYCGRDAIIRRATNKLRRGRKSILHELCEGNFSALTPRLITEAADQGDALAQEVYAETGEMLGVAVANYINIFAPDVFAIGGQISKAGKWIMEPLKASCVKIAITSLYPDCTITLAEQVEDAGMLGGAALAFEGLKWNPTN